MSSRSKAGPNARVSDSRVPFLTVGGALFSVAMGVNLATPLYAIYRQRFGFSSVVLTLVFAIYALVLIPSLLLFGQLSDRLGRRRVIATGLGVAGIGLVLFALAQGTAWLFAARAVQGLAVGMISGAANAALVELEPHGDRRRAAVVAALAQAGGSGGGPLLGGMLAQWAPAPRVFCYLVGLAAAGAAALAVIATPESAPKASGRWRIQRPGVPGEIRSAFARVGLTAAAVWAVAALFLSVVPSYAAKLLSSHNLALLGAITAVMLAASCAAQLASRLGIAPRRLQGGGLVLLATGLSALALAFPAHSLIVLLCGALLAGAGHGTAFLGSQNELNQLAPSQRRGEVTAAFYVCIYLGVALPVIGVGLIALSASLGTAVAVFAAAIGALALLTSVWQVRGRDPTQGRQTA